MDLPCPKEMLCRNFPNKCDTCGANSDFINHYPCYEDRDMVEVVRCKDCKYWRQVNEERHACYMSGLEMDYDEYCSYGERKEK